MKKRMLMDIDIRMAVKEKVIKQHVKNPSTLVIDELGLDHGANRIDIAVISNEIHGFELKSDADNLSRLPRQIQAYSSVMDKVTLIVGDKHAKKAIPMIPKWWGVKIAFQGKRGAVHLVTERRNKKNSNVDPSELLKLIWKEEVILLLDQKIRVDWRIKKLRRKDIYQLVVENFTLEEIKINVRSILKTRDNWRSIPLD